MKELSRLEWVLSVIQCRRTGLSCWVFHLFSKSPPLFCEEWKGKNQMFFKGQLDWTWPTTYSKVLQLYGQEMKGENWTFTLERRFGPQRSYVPEGMTLTEKNRYFTDMILAKRLRGQEKHDSDEKKMKMLSFKIPWLKVNLLDQEQCDNTLK